MNICTHLFFSFWAINWYTKYIPRRIYLFWKFYYCLNYGSIEYISAWGSWWIKCPFMAWRVDIRGSIVNWQFVEDALEYLISHFKNCDWQFYANIDIKLRFLTLSSFEVRFRSVLNGLEGHNCCMVVTKIDYLGNFLLDIFWHVTCYLNYLSHSLAIP